MSAASCPRVRPSWRQHSRASRAIDASGKARRSMATRIQSSRLWRTRDLSAASVSSRATAASNTASIAAMRARRGRHSAAGWAASTSACSASTAVSAAASTGFCRPPVVARVTLEQGSAAGEGEREAIERARADALRRKRVGEVDDGDAGCDAQMAGRSADQRSRSAQRSKNACSCSAVT